MYKANCVGTSSTLPSLTTSLALASQLEMTKGTLVDESFGYCHHLSYARTVRELGNKFRSFEHSGEVGLDWIDKVFLKWRENNALTDLHPTSPAAYKSTRRTTYADLPAELRNHVFANCHCAECLGGAMFEGDDWDARAMVCGAEEEDTPLAPTEPDAIGKEWDDFVNKAKPANPTATADPAKLPITTEGMEVELEGTSSQSKHGVIRKLTTTVDPEEIKPEHLEHLDPVEWLEDDEAPCGGR